MKNSSLSPVEKVRPYQRATNAIGSDAPQTNSIKQAIGGYTVNCGHNHKVHRS